MDYYELEREVAALMSMLHSLQSFVPVNPSVDELEILYAKLTHVRRLLKIAEKNLEQRIELLQKARVFSATNPYVVVRCINDPSAPELRIHVDFESGTLDTLMEKIEQKYGLCGIPGFLVYNPNAALKGLSILESGSLAVIKRK